MAILGDLLVQGSSRFLQHIYASSLTISDDFTATGDLNVGGAATIAGTLTLTKNTGLAYNSNTGPALIVGGLASAQHLEFDPNEIQSKSNASTTADLYLNAGGNKVVIGVSSATTEVLNVRGKATFAQPVTFSSAVTHSSNLTVNGTTSLKGTGVSGTLSVSGLTTIQNSLIVEEEIRSPKWIIDNIANLGGEFVVAPTIVCTEPTVAVSGTTITITDSSITGAEFAGTTWTNGSIVKVSGTIKNVVLTSVNGTMTRELNATTTHTIQFTVPSGTTLPANGTYSGANVKNLHIMLYKRGGTAPVGIFMTSYGNTKKPYIEIYDGTLEANQTFYTPRVRLGHLANLKNSAGTQVTINGLTPEGWGLYTDRGYFSGVIVSKQGNIGGWTIDDAALYKGTDSLDSKTKGLFLGTNGIRNYESDTQYVNITAGKITALGVDLTGEITATSGTIGGLTIKNSYITSNTSKTTYNNTSVDGVFIGPTGIGLGKGKFYVSNAGALTATSGTIAGWTIGANTISHGTLGATNGYMLNSAGNSSTTINNTSKTNWALTIGNKFGVDNEGNLYANGANITNITIGNTDLQIGGKNLLGNTGNSKVTILNNSSTSATFMSIGNYNDAETLYSFINYDGYSNAISVGSSTSTGNRGVSWYTKPGKIIAGQKYTFSCKIKCSVATSVHMHTAWRNGSATAVYTGWTSEGVKAISANVWTDYVCTFTPNSSANLNYEFLVAICITGVSGGAIYQVAHAKLEKGNIATAWTPAPEDTVNGGGENLLKKDYTAFNQTSYLVYNIPTTVSLTEMGEGTILTFQAWGVVPDNNSSGIYVYWGGGSINLFNKMLPDENGYICQTITITSSQASHSNASNKFIHIYNFVSGHSGMNLTIDHWKLEQGSIPTPWSLASEDVDYSITHIDGGNITTGNISADRIKTNLLTAINASITKLSALTATIGGFTIKDTYITSNTNKTTYNNTSVDGVFIGTTGIGLGKGKFYVSNTGALTATSATITGTINATNGYIGSSATAGWDIDGNIIKHVTTTNAGAGKTSNYILNAAGNTSATINGTPRSNLALTIGSKFGVDNDGNLYASGLNITNIDINNTNLEIGGRNLIRYSNQFKAGSVASSSVMQQTVDENGWYKMVISGTNNNWNAGWYLPQTGGWLVDDNLNEGDPFTVSFIMKATGSTIIPTIYLKNGLGYFQLQGELSENWSTVSYSGTWQKANNMEPHLGWGAINTNSTYWIKAWKLEKGNVATVWTPAPEDVTDFVNTRNSETGAIIDSALDAITSAQSAADNAAAAALLAQSTADDALQDANTANTAAANAQNKADQTASDLQSFRNNYENYVASVTQTYVTADSFNVKVDAIDNTFKQYSDWMTFTRINDNPTLEIGTTDSPIKGRFSNQGLNFVSGNDILLDLDGEHSKVIASNLDISTKITIGEYAWTPNGDGISLVYIGES